MTERKYLKVSGRYLRCIRNLGNATAKRNDETKQTDPKVSKEEYFSKKDTLMLVLDCFLL